MIKKQIESKLSIGDKTRRMVLGQEHVDAANENKSILDEAFQELIVEGAWGAVWSRPDLSKRERSMITLAILASQSNWDEFDLHLRACKNTGASLRDVTEVLLHVGIYAGVPKANTGMKKVKNFARKLDK